MKKTYPFLIATFFAANFSNGQSWSGTTPGNIYYNSGNVGVGTMSPGSLLQVGSATTRGTLSLIDGTGSLPGLSISNLATGGHSYTFYGGLSGAGNFDLYDQTSSAYRLTVAANGNIGIGATSPGALLEVGSATTRGTGNIVSGNGQAPVLSFTDLNTGGHQYALYSGSSAAGNFDIADITAAISRLTILGNGSVGIGTTSPGSATKLQVAGEGLFTSGSPDPGDGTPVGLRLGYYPTGDYGFIQSNQTGVINKTLILQPQGGNVGIGTSAPDALLAVKGTIHTQEVKVDMTGWNDYVFKPTYRLPKLSDVKTYINANHHLPDMPSEKEVVENGINLTEMLKLQQKKIEELTLYLIEKDKQLSEQQVKNKQQSKRIAALEAVFTKLTSGKRAR